MRNVSTQKFGLAAIACALLAMPLVAGCGADFDHPVTPQVLKQLPPKDANNLQQWSTNHPEIFGPRLHSIKTCPFLAYSPAYAFMHDGDQKQWAQWLLQYYQAKHEEEDNCTCVTNP
jgi:hypothetical protein